MISQQRAITGASAAGSRASPSTWWCWPPTRSTSWLRPAGWWPAAGWIWCDRACRWPCAPERRAPDHDRAEIASRLGWLNKELGDTRAAGRYFSRSRADDARPLATYWIIAVTAVTSLVALQPAGSDLLTALWLDKDGLAAGEWWRLVTPVLVHGSLLHLLFNMYFLYLVGPLVEQLYGSLRFLLLYALTAAAGSAASAVAGHIALPDDLG